MQTRFRFTDEDIAAFAELMEKTRKADTPHEERRAVAYAIGWMERRTGAAIGTKADRPGMDFAASGDPTQQDCVDEATNTTSYLLVLAAQQAVAASQRRHAVRQGEPAARRRRLAALDGCAAENANGQRWAVDSWIFANGENPAMVEVEKWYISSLDNLPPALSNPRRRHQLRCSGLGWGGLARSGSDGLVAIERFVPIELFVRRGIAPPVVSHGIGLLGRSRKISSQHFPQITLDDRRLLVIAVVALPEMFLPIDATV